MSTGSRSALSSLNSIQYPEKLKVRFDTISIASTIRWWFLFFFYVVEYIPSSCLSSIHCVHLGVRPFQIYLRVSLRFTTRKSRTSGSFNLIF